jgi:hypothetical protein
MTTAPLRRFYWCLLVVAVTILAGCDVSVGKGGLSVSLLSGRASDEWTKTYQIGSSPKVEIVNGNGLITVEATDGNIVEVRAEREAKAGSDQAAKDLLGKLEIREESSPDAIRLETRAPSGGIATSYQVRYFVKVPRAARVILETVNGNVTVQGLQGEARAATTNGTVSGRSLSGKVEASSTNGAIRLDLNATSIERVKAEVVNGAVELNLPAAAHANITASTVNGAVHVSGLSIDDTSERSRRHLEGRLNGGGGQIDLDVTNGAIRLNGKSNATNP